METGYEEGVNPPIQSQAEDPTQPTGSSSAEGSNSPIDPSQDPNTVAPENPSGSDPADPNPNDTSNPVEPPTDSNYREPPSQPISTVLNDDQINWTGLSAAPYDWIEIMNPQGPVNVYPSNDPS